jgi:D-sedoheptulose 7-phosphate isomerase
MSIATVEGRFLQTARNYERLAASAAAVAGVADALCDAIRNGGKILFCGNGGSAADAQHFSAELTGRFLHDRRPLPALDLVCNAATVTSIANDYGYEAIFERQVRAIGCRGDALVGITTSGNSPNVVAALRAARELGMLTVALTGERTGAVDDYSDHCLKVPSADTPRIQEMHIAVGHMLCELIEQQLG